MGALGPGPRAPWWWNRITASDRRSWSVRACGARSAALPIAGPSLSATPSIRSRFRRRSSSGPSGSRHGAASRSRPRSPGRRGACEWRSRPLMAKPAAPGLRIRRYAAGEWTDLPDAVVTEEPLQLLLDGDPLAVVMRTPGNDIELALGLLFAEGVIRTSLDVRAIRISAEAGEPRRKLERSMLASSACGVCGTQMIEDLRRDLAPLPSGLAVDPALLPPLVGRLRSGQGVFERTGGLHAAGLFDVNGEVVALREDIGRHNAVDKVVGRLLLDGRLPAAEMLLVVSGRACYEI